MILATQEENIFLSITIKNKFLDVFSLHAENNFQPIDICKLSLKQSQENIDSA